MREGRKVGRVLMRGNGIPKGLLANRIYRVDKKLLQNVNGMGIAGPIASLWSLRIASSEISKILSTFIYHNFPWDEGQLESNSIKPSPPY